MKPLNWNEIAVCVVCWALVPLDAFILHEGWHEQISNVAIESTLRIKNLEDRNA